ncbi:hypothetical protein [Actinoallomurus sp. CA-142502]|uniref:hypothetical protein n=1 Tax=Actinoallomurus sp. CA-142502 TaxID=3239885 RepID=UPI003D8C4E67
MTSGAAAGDIGTRAVTIDGERRPHMSTIGWCGLISVLGLPGASPGMLVGKVQRRPWPMPATEAADDVRGAPASVVMRRGARSRSAISTARSGFVAASL